MGTNFLSTFSLAGNISSTATSENINYHSMCKRILLIVAGIFFSLILHAQVSRSLSVNAGSLSTALTNTELQTVTSLTLTGTIDARDFKTMRDEMPLLAEIDLRGATIAEYTGELGTYLSSNFHFPPDEIPYSAFYNSNSVGKRSLTSIVLPESITAIGPFAFRGCDQLASFNIPGVIISIGDYAFGSCNSLTSFSIPEGTATIGVFVFESCLGMSSVTIPSTVSSIGEGAFMSFPGKINVDEGNHSYSSRDGVLYNKTQTALIQCPISKKHNYQIPESVTSIGNYAFYSCKSLTSIAVPSMVTTIGKEAFTACSGITSLTIPAFVNYIGPQAFWGCKSLINITSRNPVPVVFGSSFEVFGEINKSNCYLNVPYGTSALFRDADQWKDFTNIIEISGFKLSEDTVNLQSVEGITTNIYLSTDSNWSASSDQAWLTVNPTSGSGNNILNLAAQANFSDTVRMATVTISSGSYESQKITVFQDKVIAIPVVQKPLAHIKKTNVVPILDGSIDAVWSNVSENNIAVPYRTETPTLGALGETNWRALWNDDGIYVLVTVADDVFSPYYSGTDVYSWWMYDKTEMFFDCNSVKKDGKGTARGYNGEGDDGHHCFYSTPVINSVSGGVISETNANGSYFSYRVTGSGYVVEQFIPFSRLTDKNGAIVDKSQPIGFDLTVVDNDLKTPNRNRMNWSNNGVIDECWNNMDDAGLIQLDSAGLIDTTGISKDTIGTGPISPDNGSSPQTTDPDGLDHSFLPITYIYISAELSSIPIDIPIATNWKVISDQSWLNVNPQTGNGSATLSLTMLENSSSIPRSGTLIVFNEGIASQLYIVTQDGENLISNNEGTSENSEVFTKKINITGKESKALINISAEPTSVVSDQSWLSVSPLIGNSDKTLSFTFEPNPTNMLRTATITVLTSGIVSQTIIVTQNPGNITTGLVPINADQQLTVYPNPTSGKCKLAFDQLPPSGTFITVRDFSGKTILKQCIQNTEEWIDLEGYAPGIYFIGANLPNLRVQKLILK